MARTIDGAATAPGMAAAPGGRFGRARRRPARPAATLVRSLATNAPSMFSRLREDITCILERDPAARSRLEVLLCYPGLHALIWHRRAKWFWTHGMHVAGRFMSHLGRFFTGIEIHPGATIGRRVFIDHGMGVVIGEMAEIHDDCTIYQGVTLGGTSLVKGAKRHPTLEAGVIVGANASVLGGFTVGAGARVGSGAVVTRPVPAGATAVGNPARIIAAETDAAREATAARLGFSAYGVTQGDDPVALAMKGLIDNASAHEHQIALLWTRARARAGRRRRAGQGLRAHRRADRRELRRRGPEPAGQVVRCEIDHLVVTAPTLESGADFVEQALGVAPGPGGQHPRMGTHNLLLRLGESTFLEVHRHRPGRAAAGSSALVRARRTRRRRPPRAWPAGSRAPTTCARCPADLLANARRRRDDDARHARMADHDPGRRPTAAGRRAADADRVAVAARARGRGPARCRAARWPAWGCAIRNPGAWTNCWPWRAWPIAWRSVPARRACGRTSSRPRACAGSAR